MKIWEPSTAIKAPANDATYTVECDRRTTPSMTLLRHAIVDDLCHHLQASTVWFADKLEGLGNPSPATRNKLSPEEVERVIAREEANIAPALATLGRAGRHPRYEASDYGNQWTPPNPGARLPSPSLVDELCDQLEHNLSWPILDAYYLREWPRPRGDWDLADAEKRHLAELFRSRLAQSRQLLRRCGWNNSGSWNTINVAV